MPKDTGNQSDRMSTYNLRGAMRAMTITEAIVIIAALIYTGFVFYILNK